MKVEFIYLYIFLNQTCGLTSKKVDLMENKKT